MWLPGNNSSSVVIANYVGSSESGFTMKIILLFLSIFVGVHLCQQDDMKVGVQSMMADHLEGHHHVDGKYIMHAVMC